FLDEKLALEGRGYTGGCEKCYMDNKSAYYRCEDCFDLRMMCADCIVGQHQPNPFHWIQKWDGSSFVRVSLKELGLQVVLGHPLGTKCDNPKSSDKLEYVVLDTNGIHVISLSYCECASATDPFAQFLQMRLFPATVTYPRTAATFRLLQSF
ncbi:hypothetical protein BDN72DRAFT_747722, partial [Pluteus cervinus]